MGRKADAGILMGAATLAGALLLFVTVLVQVTLSAPLTPSPHTSDAPAASDEGPYPRTEAATAPGAAAEPGRAAHQEVDRVSMPREALRLAVARAPFAPARTPAAARYRMPGERVPGAQPTEPPLELPPPPELEVLGTVSGPTGGLAVIQLDDEAPSVISMGDLVEGYRITEIAPGDITLEGQGRSVTVAVAGPSPTGPPVEERRRDRRRGNDRDRRGNRR